MHTHLQADVEAFFTSAGYLLPSYHKAYWLGISALTWGNWRWTDPTAGSFSAARYRHWGKGEPSNGPGLQLCGAGAASSKAAWPLGLAFSLHVLLPHKCTCSWSEEPAALQVKPPV